MTRQEVTEKLQAKLVANRDECRAQLERIASEPAHHIHSIGPEGQRVNLLTKLSETWKEGQAIRELAQELVGLLYSDEVPPNTVAIGDVQVTATPKGPPS